MHEKRVIGYNFITVLTNDDQNPCDQVPLNIRHISNNWPQLVCFC